MAMVAIEHRQGGHMVWATIKTTAFVGLAVATGVVCTSVPIAGKTISARLSETSAAAARKGGVSTAGHSRSEGDEAPAPGVAALKAGRIDPRAVATVIPDQPTGDNLRPTEREAISHLIEQKARGGKSAKP
jgi:hypothetical protein